MPQGVCLQVKEITQLTGIPCLKWAITDKFHEYLYGAEFQVFTDNNPLTYILTTAKLDATGHRWVAALSNYTFSIPYKPGRNNTDADALSRIHGLRQLISLPRLYMQSVKEYRYHMARLKLFAMGPKQ